MSTADPNLVILTGENPFIRLSESDDGPVTTNASFWRVIFSPGGPGHVLYLKSELTDERWRIYSDNIAMARWLQNTVQGMLNEETADTAIPVTDAQFSKSGDPRYFWTERLASTEDEILLTWYELGDPLMLHTQPHEPPERRYGVNTIPCSRSRCAPHRERCPGARPGLAAGARGTPVQHLCARVLRELDGDALAARTCSASTSQRGGRRKSTSISQAALAPVGHLSLQPGPRSGRLD